MNKVSILFRYPTLPEAEKWAETQGSLLTIYYSQQQTAQTARQTWIVGAWSVTSTLAGLLFIVQTDTELVKQLIALGFFAVLAALAWRLFVFAVVEDIKVFRSARKIAAIEQLQIWAGKRPRAQKDTIDYLTQEKSKKLNTWHGILIQMIVLQVFMCIAGLIKLNQTQAATWEYVVGIVVWLAMLTISIIKLPRSRTKYHYSLYGFARVGDKDVAAEAKSHSLGQTETIDQKTYYSAEGEVYEDDPLTTLVAA